MPQLDNQHVDFFRLATVSIALCTLCPGVLAQFDRQPWPARALAPALRWTDTAGKAWDGAALKGSVVVLNFWATWCAPCKEELPSLLALSEISDPQQLRVFAVNVREPAARAQRYLQSSQLAALPLVSDAQGELARRWGVSIYPTTVLIGPDGQARWRIVGAVDWSGRPAQDWVQALQAPAAPAATR